MTTSHPNKMKKHFEENMLDGDKVEDCGGAMLSAKSVWEYLRSELTKAREEEKERIYKFLKKRIGGIEVFLDKLK